MRNWFEYAIVLVVRALVRVFPRWISLGIGDTLGLFFYLVYRRRRELAVANLRAAFPFRTERECYEILRSTFSHFGRHVVELLIFNAVNHDQTTNFIEIKGEKWVQKAMAQGKGVMYYTGHFGYWELLLMVHALRFKPMVIVARTLDNPFLERLMEKIRTRVGTRAISRHGAVRGLLRALRNNESVGMLIDQHTQSSSSVMVDFLNRPAATTSALASLALRTGAPVIPVFALPLPGGNYRLIYEPPVEPPAENDPDPVRTYTQRCTNVLEEYVQQYPNLWLWMHRRWRVDATGLGIDPKTAVVSTNTVARKDVFP